MDEKFVVPTALRFAVDDTKTRADEAWQQLLAAREQHGARVALSLHGDEVVRLEYVLAVLEAMEGKFEQCGSIPETYAYGHQLALRGLCYAAIGRPPLHAAVKEMERMGAKRVLTLLTEMDPQKAGAELDKPRRTDR